MLRSCDEIGYRFARRNDTVLMLPGELALRTGTAAILLVTGIVLLRDWRRTDSGPFGGLLALSVTVVSISGVISFSWLWPSQLLAMGAPALLWIWVWSGLRRRRGDAATALVTLLVRTS